MHVVVYLPLVLPALAALFARWLAGHMEPRTATWLLTASAVGLAAASATALALLAATALGQVPLLATLGDWSAEVMRREDPTSVTLAVGAGLLFAVALAAAVWVAIRLVRALAGSARAAQGLPRRGRLAVLDDPAPDAYALPGLPGRIVVTAGMLDVLDDRERRVLLAHERAHLAGAHYLFVTLTHLAAAANPLLRPVVSAVRYTVERWADEKAASVTGDRRLVATTIGKAALLTSSHPGKPATALGAGSGSLRGTGPVPRRVAALLAAPPRPSPMLVAAALAVLAVAAASTVEAAHDLHSLLQAAGGP